MLYDNDKDYDFMSYFKYLHYNSIFLKLTSFYVISYDVHLFVYLLRMFSF